jgi:tetratricopeptide (TPR) repeat protein
MGEFGDYGGRETMSFADRMNTLWRRVGARSGEGRRLRRRLGAGAALATLLGGFLAAIGFVVVLVVALAVVVTGLGVAAATAAIARYAPALRARWPRWLERLERQGGRLRAAMLGLVRALIAWTRVATSRAVQATRWALRRVRARAPQVAAASSELASQATLKVASGRRAAAVRLRPLAALPQRVGRSPSTAQTVRRRREALRLNAFGVQLRRSGSHAEAAERHRAALEILRQLDDRRAVALTLNNLALALSHNGDDAAAVGLFEEAAALLRELGDQEHEGQVIANLGLAHRRHGRREEADDVLEIALTKLAPASTAYRTVEAELRRAS